MALRTSYYVLCKGHVSLGGVRSGRTVEISTRDEEEGYTEEVSSTSLGLGRGSGTFSIVIIHP